MSDPKMGGMYAVIPASVLYDDSIRPTAKLLYGEIVRLAQASGYCYATTKWFTRLCGCSERTVRDLISQLADRGHIRISMIRRHGETGDVIQRRIYVGQALASEDPNDPNSAQDETDDLNVPDKPDPDVDPEICLSEVGQKIAPPSGEKLPQGGAENCRYKNTSIKNTKERYAPIVPREIEKRIEEYCGGDTELHDAILGLCENRKAANHKPVATMRTIDGILRELSLHSEGYREIKLAMLEKATVSNWLTVFPLRKDELPSRAGPRVRESDGVKFD